MRGSLAALALLAGVPAAAQEGSEPAPDFSAMTDAELKARADAFGSPGQSACRDLVPVYVELDRRHRSDRLYEPSLLFGQALCANHEQRAADGMRYVKQFERSYPERGPLGWLGLLLAAQLGDGAEVMAQLRALSAAGIFVKLPKDVLSWSYRVARDGGRREELEAFSYEVATSSPFGQLDVEIQDMLAQSALARVARSGETAQLDTLLGHVRSPSSVLGLLASREYEAIWPQLERHAGDHLAKLSDDYVAWTASRLADKPEDRDRLSANSYALLFAGRYREAVELAQGLLDGKQHDGEIEEGEGWALNIQAYAYDALGQMGEADRVLDRLARLSPEEHRWVLNFVINRAVRLVKLRRWEEGLAASDVARPATDMYGTPYARMLVASYRACALHKLGRTDESARELDFVREHFADAPGHGGAALLCADLDDEAAQHLAGALAEEASRSRLLDDMQDARFSLFGTPEPQLRQSRELVIERPELRDVALQHVRVLPERFVPIAYLRRQELANARGAK